MKDFQNKKSFITYLLLNTMFFPIKISKKVEDLIITLLFNTEFKLHITDFLACNYIDFDVATNFNGKIDIEKYTFSSLSVQVLTTKSIVYEYGQKNPLMLKYIQKYESIYCYGEKDGVNMHVEMYYNMLMR